MIQWESIVIMSLSSSHGKIFAVMYEAAFVQTRFGFDATAGTLHCFYHNPAIKQGKLSSNAFSKSTTHSPRRL